MPFPVNRIFGEVDRVVSSHFQAHQVSVSSYDGLIAQDACQYLFFRNTLLANKIK